MNTKTIQSVGFASNAPEAFRSLATAMVRDLKISLFEGEASRTAGLQLWSKEDALEGKGTVIAERLQRELDARPELKTQASKHHTPSWHAIFSIDNAIHVTGSSPRAVAFGALAIRDAMLGMHPAAANEGLHVDAFAERYVTWDQTCNQIARFCKGFDRSRHFEEACRMGLTGVEINRSPDQQVHQVTHLRRKEDPYPWVNDYGLALDMFAESDLNRGTYPSEVISRHRADLAEASREASRWNLASGMMCYEPRWVPESFFEKHPRLRGARVDHCGRSFAPRYTLDIAHPDVLEHYQQLLSGVFEIVDNLEYLHVWHCDSGAGYPYAKYLYPGPNGSHRAKAKPFGALVCDFLGALAEEGRRHNRDFKVIQANTWEFTEGEWQDVLKRLPPGVEVSHAVGIDEWKPIRDKELYAYGGIAGGVTSPGQTLPLATLDRTFDREPFIEVATAHAWDLEPCCGTDFPGLLIKKFESLKTLATNRMMVRCGFPSPPMVSRSINNELLRECYQGTQDFEAVLQDRASAWTENSDEADAVRFAWSQMDHAIAHIPTSTFFAPSWAMGWGQWLFRPLVPDRTQLSASELHELTTHEFYLEDDPGRLNIFFEGYERIYRDDDSGWFVEIYDEDVLPTLMEAITRFGALEPLSPYGSELADRVKAHYHILMTYRNWISAQRAINLALKENREAPLSSEHTKTLRMDITSEWENLTALANLIDHSPYQLLLETEGKRNVYRHADISRLLRKKVNVMKTHAQDAPGPWLEAFESARERLTRPRPIGGGATGIAHLLLDESENQS